MKQTILRRLTAAILSLTLAFLLGACGGKEGEIRQIDPNGTYLYYLSKSGNSLYPVVYAPQGGTTVDLVEEYVRELTAEESSDRYQELLPKDLAIKSHTLDPNGILTLDFSPQYTAMEPTREVLVRAGVVRTLMQTDGVTGVRFTVTGKPALDARGTDLGVMNADTFIENAKQINDYQHVNINLYFADASGRQLQMESRSIYYSSSKPLEWAIVERLIAGPKVEGNHPSLPAGTQILSVTNSDDICYVNLSRSFITDAQEVDERIPIYSIVNSICDNSPAIKRVQISIEGDTDVTFRKHMNLAEPYQPDASLVRNLTESGGV